MSKKHFDGDLNRVNEKKQKLTAENFYKKIKKKKKIILFSIIFIYKKLIKKKI